MVASMLHAIKLQGPGKLDPRHKVDFLHAVASIGMDIGNNEEIVQCYGRLQRMYLAMGCPPRRAEQAAE